MKINSLVSLICVDEKIKLTLLPEGYTKEGYVWAVQPHPIHKDLGVVSIAKNTDQFKESPNLDVMPGSKLIAKEEQWFEYEIIKE